MYVGKITTSCNYINDKKLFVFPLSELYAVILFWPGGVDVNFSSKNVKQTAVE